MANITQKTLIGHILFSAILLLILTKFLCLATNTPYPIEVVTSDSMSPTLMEGDIIFWIPTPIMDVQPDDIIIFQSRIHYPETKLVTHRVINTTTNTYGLHLTTKGDANTWPDQSGPHLPEPYITKDNYVGTLLTLGPIPLKIPFIGGIGIVITELMDTLSQTARNQDLITYLGVFAPLTIALILLFVSLLLLPEKPKNLKQKITQLILPIKQISVLKLFTSFFLLFFILSLCTHHFAYDSFTATLGVNTNPDTTQFSFGYLKPNQTSFPKHIPLINPGVMPIQGYLYGDEDLLPYVQKETFNLPPASNQQINLTANIPPNAPDGHYQGTIKIYSSALWILLPPSLLNIIITIYPTYSLYILDGLSAIIFTILSIALMLLFTLIQQNHLHHQFHTLFHTKSPRHLPKMLNLSLKKIKKHIQSYHWIHQKPINPPTLKKILIILIPSSILSFLLNFTIVSILIIPLLITTSNYLLGHNTRQHIIQTTTITIILTTTLLLIHTIIATNPLTLEQPLTTYLTTILGCISIYLFMIGCLLLPLTFINWRLIHSIHNIKEQIKPLQLLEGHSDL